MAILRSPVSRLAILAACLAFAAPHAAWAAKKPQVLNACNTEVRFAPGASSASVRSQIKGDGYCEYRLRARSGQQLQAQLQAASQLDVILYGDETVDLGDGSSYTLPADGLYQVRVLQSRNAARKSARALPFALTISIR